MASLAAPGSVDAVPSSPTEAPLTSRLPPVISRQGSARTNRQPTQCIAIKEVIVSTCSECWLDRGDGRKRIAECCSNALLEPISVGPASVPASPPNRHGGRCYCLRRPLAATKLRISDCGFRIEEALTLIIRNRQSTIGDFIVSRETASKNMPAKRKEVSG